MFSGLGVGFGLGCYLGLVVGFGCKVLVVGGYLSLDWLYALVGLGLGFYYWVWVVVWRGFGCRVWLIGLLV